MKLTARINVHFSKRRDILKKIVVSSVLILLSAVLFGCNLFSKNDLPIEMVAFNSLSEKESALIPVSPKDSLVKKVTVDNDIESFINHDYDKDEVYSVTFNHTNTETSGNIIVFVDLDKKNVVGKRVASKKLE